MPGINADVDPDGLLEYSVVFTDRALNHMSKTFQGVMNDISTTMRGVYNADGMAVIPGGGTFGMEAVTRQFANDEECLVIRNGFFSFRWSQILETGRIASNTSVLKAHTVNEASEASWEPAPVAEVVSAVHAKKPKVVFAPHVETASGMLLPDDYLKSVADATHAEGGLFVLDCIASGTLWVDMKAVGVDVLLSAPQKGWSSTPCAALVMMSDRALAQLETTTSSSFACDLAKWHSIMKVYEAGGHAYHATLPTDGLRKLAEEMNATRAAGFDAMRNAQIELGSRVRAVLADAGFKSVAGPGFEAPGVIVSYTDDPNIQNGSRFAAAGLQIAAGVPLHCDEPADFRTFRLGLFGLDKLNNIDRTVANLEKGLAAIKD